MSNERLTNDNYIRPKITKTDMLTKEEIDDLLEDYVKVDDITKISIGSHLRYFDISNEKKPKFRYGGTLILTCAPKYVVLKNGKSWSVQIDRTIFYRRLKIQEVRDEYEELLDKCEEKIKDLKYQRKELKNKNEDLFNEIEKLKKYIKRHT